MRLLRLIGPDEDGTSLIVEAVETEGIDSEPGERFALSLDERLRTMAAAKPDQQSEASSSTPVASGPVPTPREIQVRVRAGETAQAVADQAGIPLERVMRFAYPVLQERVRVTDEARRARARRGGDGLLVPFGELIDSRLARHGVDPTSVRWDAFRREDGGWTVTSAFSAHQRDVLAKFSFALANRTVSALEDIAADLLSDRPVQALLAPPAAPEPVADPAGSEWAPEWGAAAGPRLTAVPDPSRTDAPRPQEASAAVRPPSRRQKAHTRPVPVNLDDELFDQDAFDQQPWHEPPLPFEVGSGRGATVPASSPRQRPQRPVGEAPAASSGSAGVAHPEAARSAGPELTDSNSPRGVTPDSSGAANLDFEQLGLEQLSSEQAGPAQPEWADVESLFESSDSTASGSTASGSPASDSAPADSASGSNASDSAPADSVVAARVTVATPAVGEGGADEPVSARAGTGEQAKRGRRAGEKPRMPSWDDILLGVRHKSD